MYISRGEAFLAPLEGGAPFLLEGPNPLKIILTLVDHTPQRLDVLECFRIERLPLAQEP
jgi:hypothetical protein